MKTKILIIAMILLLAAGTLLIVERAQAQICEPGHHGNYGCMDSDLPAVHRPNPGATATPLPAPSPTPTVTPAPDFCSIHGCE